MTERENCPEEIFNSYADEYQAMLARSVNRFGEEYEYFVRYKLERIRKLCRVSPPTRILDIGCGVGLLTELLGRAFPAARVTGLDVSTRSLSQAASRCVDLKNIEFHAYDGALPPSLLGRVDLAVLANVLHHVEPSARRRFMEQVVLPSLVQDGRVVVFEHNPYNPFTRMVVRFCPVDQNAHLLTLATTLRLLRDCHLRVLQRDYIVFFPRLLRWFRVLEERMGWLPAGAQYVAIAQCNRPQGPRRRAE